MSSESEKVENEQISIPESEKELNKLTKKDLQALCSAHGLSTAGKRSDLYDRLYDFLDFETKTGKTKQTKTVKSTKDELQNELFRLNKQRDGKENLDRVIEGYDELLENYENDEYVLLNKGITLQYRQEYNKAVECFTAALKKNPDNIEARMLLEGCRVMGVAASAIVPEEIDKKEKGLEDGAVELTEKNDDSIDEFGRNHILPVPEEVISGDDTETVATAESEETTPEIHAETKEKVIEKVHIAGTKQKDEKQRSLLGDTMVDFDTQTLVESKTRLLDVLQELKSELHQEGGDKTTAKPEDKSDLEHQDEMKPLDLEKQSLNEILDIDKSDDDYGKKILNSARKLLSMTENLSDEGSFSKGGFHGQQRSGPASDEKRPGFTESSEIISLPKKSISKLDLHPKPTRRKPTVATKVRTGNISLDKLLQGGFMSASNILVNGPPFVDKDILLYKFATMGLRMNVPCIIINPETAPATIMDKFEKLLGNFSEYEEKDLIFWLDPETEESKKKFGNGPYADFPEKHRIILNGIEHYSDKIFDIFEYYNVIFFSMSPMLMFQEPKTVNSFLSKFSQRIKEDNAVALYTIDNTAHDSQEMGFVKRIMDGIVEIKQEAGYADHVAPTNYLKIDKLPYSSSYEWHKFLASDKNFEIRAIPTYKKVM